MEYNTKQKVCQQQKVIEYRGSLIRQNRTISLMESSDFVIMVMRSRLRRYTAMSIIDTELKANLSKYLLLSATEDIYITRNGKVISKLTNPFQERVDIAKSARLSKI